MNAKSWQDLGRFSGRAVVITGGARGIGLAIAKRCAGEGGRIALWDIDGEAARDAAASLGGGHIGLAVDVTDESAIIRAAETTWSACGRIDLLVNNAGILGPVANTWDHTADEFRNVVEVNLIGCFLVCRVCVPLMLLQDGPTRGRIVNVSSVQAKEGMAEASAYSASKAGIISLTKTLGKELAKLGILVNCITPAAAETEMASMLSPQRRADILTRIPMGRFVEVGEIAAMIAFLGSDDCSFSTGAVFDLSGGRATF